MLGQGSAGTSSGSIPCAGWDGGSRLCVHGAGGVCFGRLPSARDGVWEHGKEGEAGNGDLGGMWSGFILLPLVLSSFSPPTPEHLFCKSQSFQPVFMARLFPLQSSGRPPPPAERRRSWAEEERTARLGKEFFNTCVLCFQFIEVFMLS